MPIRWIRPALALVIALGAGRIAFYYLLHEPLTVHGRQDAADGYLPLRAHLAGLREIGYLSDEPLDEDPAVPRQFDTGDMMYARAQYALAPTLLSRSVPEMSLVLANFRDPAALSRLIASQRYAVVARAGPAVALLEPK